MTAMMFNALMVLGLCVVSAMTIEIRWQIRAADFNQQLAAAQVDKQLAEQLAQRLLNNGRWIRTYDPTSGNSTYRFASRKEQR